jgi:hypothetical protein
MQTVQAALALVPSCETTMIRMPMMILITMMIRGGGHVCGKLQDTGEFIILNGQAVVVEGELTDHRHQMHL